MRLILLLSTVILFCFTIQSFATIIESSSIEDDQTWSVGTTNISFVDAGSGITTPTDGGKAFHFNSGFSTTTTGTNSIVFNSILEVGEYQATIDVGNQNNAPFADIGHLGITAAGSLLDIETFNTPTPSLGTIEIWTFTYLIDAQNPLLGQSIGFEIFVPFTSGSKNVTFDNLAINFEASIPEMSTCLYLLLSICVMGRFKNNFGK